MERQKKKENGITLIALVISIIVMLILAGVSLNMTVGDNGIIKQAQAATYAQSVAALEEFLQQKYISKYESVEDLESKVLGLINAYPEYFYVPANEGIGSLKYIVDSDGHVLFLIKKSGLPQDIRSQLVGGEAGSGTYAEYAALRDVYGVTSNLKVYYSPAEGEKLTGLDIAQLDKDDPEREVFGRNNTLTSVLGAYDTSGDGIISAEEAKSVIDLKIDSTSGITSLKDIYNLTSLKTITLENMSLENLDGIQNCTNLYSIYIKNCTIRNYTAVGKLGSRLKYFYVYNLDDTELENICSKTVGIGSYDLPNLEYLAFVGNEGNISNMLYWSDGYNTIWDVPTDRSTRTLTKIECLNNLTTNTKKAVHYLSIHNNNIVSLKGLEEFSELILLRADVNKITSLSNIQNCSKIEVLGVSNNSLVELGNFKAGSALTTLVCYYNSSLKSLSGLENCSNLYEIFAYGCNLGGKNGTETSTLENTTSKQTTDSLASLANKTKLHKLLISNNSELKWSQYIASDTALRYLYIEGCLKIQDITNIKSIIQTCGVNAKVPSLYALSLLDANTTVLDLNGRTVNKTQFKSLKQYSKIEKLGLQNLKIIEDKQNESDNDVEITDSTTLNSLFIEALGPMTAMKYLRLYGLSHLTTISFVTNMNSLVELDLRGSGVTDLAILETKRNAGTMSLQCLAVDTEGTNLGAIPNTVSFASNHPTANWLWVANSKNGGIVCSNLKVWRTLAGSSITNLYIGHGSYRSF